MKLTTVVLIRAVSAVLCGATAFIVASCGGGSEADLPPMVSLPPTATSIVMVGEDRWDGVQVSGDGLSITIAVTTGVCGAPPTLAVDESASMVRLRLVEYVTVGTCAAMGQLHQLTATLRQPLADRQLVDETSGGIVEVSGSREHP